MFKACQLAKQYFETSIRVKRQCEMGLTEVVSHKTLQLVWVPKVVVDVLTPFSTRLSGNLAIQTTPFLFLSFFNSFSLPHFTSPENWARHLCKLVARTVVVVVLFHSQKAESLMSPLCQIQVPHLIEPWDVLPVAGFQHQRSRPSFGVSFEPLE